MNPLYNRYLPGFRFYENPILVVPVTVRHYVSVFQWLLGWMPGMYVGKRPWEWSYTTKGYEPSPNVYVVGKTIIGHPATIARIEAAIFPGAECFANMNIYAYSKGGQQEISE